MGIRFRCHHCEHELNLKNFQAGRRARCPVCSGRFRVPTESCDFSTPVDEERVEQAVASQNQVVNPGKRASVVASAAVAAVKSTGPAAASANVSATAAEVNNSTATGSVADPAISTMPAPLLLGESWPAAIAQAPQAVWYLRPPGGGQYGPVDGTVFWQWIRENRVARDAFVWRDGWPQWQVAAEAFEDIFGPMVPMSAELAGGAAASQGLALATEANTQVDNALVDNAPVVSRARPISEPAGSRKKRGSKNNYAWAIVALAVLAIALLAVLVGVLVAR